METRTLSTLEATPQAHVFPDEEPKTVRLSLDSGQRVPEHRHPGREILFHVLDGSIELTVGESTETLEAGDIARFDGEEDISPKAVTDATALVVLAERA